MNELEVLTSLHEGEINAINAYETLYPKSLQKLKRARFVRMRLHLPNESPALNMFLRIFFLFPLPVRFVMFALRFVDERHLDSTVDKKTIRKMIKYSANTRISIQSEDALIRISVD